MRAMILFLLVFGVLGCSVLGSGGAQFCADDTSTLGQQVNVCLRQCTYGGDRRNPVCPLECIQQKGKVHDKQQVLKEYCCGKYTFTEATSTSTKQDRTEYGQRCYRAIKAQAALNGD